MPRSSAQGQYSICHSAVIIAYLKEVWNSIRIKSKSEWTDLDCELEVEYSNITIGEILNETFRMKWFWLLDFFTFPDGSVREHD